MDEPRVIRPLPADVIKKIAAGEIIVRPSSAIKELIENSIDAGATEIRLNLSSNPLDFCEIIDNGCGVSEKDLLIICRRYTTSKTTNTIEGVKSLGFRGEALSSLSQNAHVTISSRTENEPRRTVLRYLDCEPVLDEISYEEGPRGFYLRYENLFYNYETRCKSLLSNVNAEFMSCLYLVQKYSIHFPKIKFSFNKINSSLLELNMSNKPCSQSSDSSQSGSSQSNCNFTTSIHSAHYDKSEDSNYNKEQKLDYDYSFFSNLNEVNTNDPKFKEYTENVDKVSMDFLKSVRENIKCIYGLNISNILNEVVFNDFKKLFFNCKGLISHPNQPCKLDMFILFVNNRLIDLNYLRRSIFTSYNEISNNKYRRFVYLSIFMPYAKIDANIHPTKKRIMIEDQTNIVEAISNFFHDKIKELIQSTNPSTNIGTTMKLVQEYKLAVGTGLNKPKETKKSFSKQADISYFSSQVPSSCVRNDIISLLDTSSYQIKKEVFDDDNTDFNKTPEKLVLTYYDNNATSTTSTTDDNHEIPKELGESEKKPERQQPTLEESLKDQKRRSSDEKEDDLEFEDEPEDEENENVKESKLDESLDLNKLRIESIQRINKLSYNHVQDSEKLGNLYKMKELQLIVDEIIQNKDDELTNITLNSSYIGMIDRSHILVDYQDNLYMINILSISKECCFQSIIWRLGNLPCYILETPVSLERLLNHSISKYNSNFLVDELLNPKLIKVLNLLFGFQIQDFSLFKIPDLLNGYFSGEEYLSDMMYHILTLKYESLKDLISKIAKTLSFYYVQPPLDLLHSEIDGHYEHFLTRILFATCQRFTDLSLPAKFVPPYHNPI